MEAGLIAQNPAVIPKYLSCVAGSMLCYKLYPTREEYIQVAVEILNKAWLDEIQAWAPHGEYKKSLPYAISLQCYY